MWPTHKRLTTTRRSASRARRVTVAVDDAADESRVDHLAVSLLLDQPQHGVGDLLVQRLEQVVAPDD